MSSSAARNWRENEKLKVGAVCNIIHIHINVVSQGFLTEGVLSRIGQNQEIKTHTVTLSCCFSTDILGSERVETVRAGAATDDSEVMSNVFFWQIFSNVAADFSVKNIHIFRQIPVFLDPPFFFFFFLISLLTT